MANFRIKCDKMTKIQIAEKILNIYEKNKIQNKTLNSFYPIFIGNRVLNNVANIAKSVCPKTNKIAIIYDINVPSKFLKNLKNKFNKFL